MAAHRVKRRVISLGLLSILFLTPLFVVIPHIHSFVQIFSEHSGIAITQDDVARAYTEDTSRSRPELIPKIIHQVWHDWSGRNGPVPEDWEVTRQTCLEATLGWEYMLWTSETSRDFIALRYPWFLDTYDGYRYPVQRVDAVRYFLMRHYGGIYIDLDNGCSQDLTPLLYYPTWTTDGGRGALSNNILASVPDHPFWNFLTDSLIAYDYNYIFPYITISYASGQWFETAVWQAYHASLTDADGSLYRVMMDSREGTDPWIFFSQERGGSWLNWDNTMFLWIGDHLILIGLCLGGFACIVIWAVAQWSGCSGQDRRKQGYKLVSEPKEIEEVELERQDHAQDRAHGTG